MCGTYEAGHSKKEATQWLTHKNNIFELTDIIFFMIALCCAVAFPCSKVLESLLAHYFLCAV